MNFSVLKKISVAITSLVAISMVLSAADMDSRVTQLENQMKQVRTETAMGTFGAKTATARPEVDGKGWFITADVLYWHAKVGGTEFAYTDNDPVAALPMKGRTKDMEFDWDWGFRVGAGYNFQHDGWDVHAQYTYFNSDGSESTSAGLNSIIVPLRGSANILNNGNIFAYCTSAKSQYDFDYQAVDLDLGRAYFLSEKFSVRPYAGLKSAWLDQEQITRYNGGEPSNNLYGVGANTVHVTEDCDFWGLGPRAGLDAKWHLGYGVSIFSNVAAALLYGYFDVDHRERYSETKDKSRIRLHANKHAFSPTVQFQLGLRYDAYVHDNKQHIGIGLGFEAQYWWRQNQMLKINDDLLQRTEDEGALVKYDRYSEDVTMYGVTLDFKWDF
jgi:hypothetical protein